MAHVCFWDCGRENVCGAGGHAGGSEQWRARRMRVGVRLLCLSRGRGHPGAAGSAGVLSCTFRPLGAAEDATCRLVV